MKKNLLSYLLLCLVTLGINAQDAARILSVSVAGDGAFISWIQEGDAGDGAVAHRVLQLVDGEFVSINETSDLNTGFFFADATGADEGPVTYAIATINADGDVLATSDQHSTVHVSITSEECADPIVIEWTAYEGFDQLVEHTVFKGEGALSEKIGTFEGDVFTTEYALQDGDEGILTFSVQSSPDGATQVASNLSPVDSCIEPGAGVPAGVDDLLVASLKIGPNPVQDIVSISYDSGFDQELNMSVFTLDGRKVKTVSFVGQASFSATDWAKGVYVYSVSNMSGELISQGKLLK